MGKLVKSAETMDEACCKSGNRKEYRQQLMRKPQVIL